MKFYFFRSVFCAFIGRQKWMKLKRRYSIDSGVYVLLMTDEDGELNEQALLHIDDLIQYRRAKGVVILTTDNWTFNNAKKYSKNIINVERITEKVAGYYYYYYYYFAQSFSDQYIAITLTRAFGSDLTQAVGVNGVTKEDLVCLGLYIMRSWQPLEEVNG